MLETTGRGVGRMVKYLDAQCGPGVGFNLGRQHTARLLVCGEQKFDAFSQRDVAVAFTVQERTALRGRLADRESKKSFFPGRGGVHRGGCYFHLPH